MTKQDHTRRSAVSAEEIAELAPESLEPTLEQPAVIKTARRHKKSSGGKVLITLLVMIIIAAAVLFYLDYSGEINLFGTSSAPTTVASFSSTGWQAVFLTNGQVYFGHLKNMDATYAELEEIYYLQVQNVPIQPAQPATEEEGVQPAEQTEQRMILVKFGTELHSPKDRMYINRDHIMFYEDLSDESSVVKSINDYLTSQVE